ncbi:MAG: hypothetical protein ACK44P_08780, partial [Bacteroidota bacterium]
QVHGFQITGFTLRKQSKGRAVVLPFFFGHFWVSAHLYSNSATLPLLLFGIIFEQEEPIKSDICLRNYGS